MIALSKKLYLAAVVALSLLAGSNGTARADKRLVCSMKGTWLETQDDFRFKAEYFAKEGIDMFRGTHVGADSGSMADVAGVASGESWSIKVAYTDKEHQGQVRELVGTGRRGASSDLTIEGNYVFKKEGQAIGMGKFVMIGKCR